MSPALLAARHRADRHRAALDGPQANPLRGVLREKCGTEQCCRRGEQIHTTWRSARGQMTHCRACGGTRIIRLADLDTQRTAVRRYLAGRC